MTNTKDKIYFSADINNRERACFETGIKLGALYHILCGIPISSNENIIKSIENGIESAISCQPYVTSVKINLKREKIKAGKKSPFDYDEISGNLIQAKILIEYESVEVLAKIEWVDEFQFPLMFIEKISDKEI